MESTKGEQSKALTKYTTVIQADRKKRKAWVSANPYTGGITSLEMLC